VNRAPLTWTDRDRWPSKYFAPHELKCRGTGTLKIDPDALDRLERLRIMCGRPLIIQSAYRSRDHNTRVGGAPKSYHLRGMAFDIQASTAAERHEVVVNALNCGFRGIGVYKTFIHVDTGGPRMWSG